MSDIALNLFVLRTPNLVRAVDFYTRLGLEFVQHRHGKGPEHYSSELDGTVFELYPQAADAPSTLGTRIGFRVSSIESILEALHDYPGAVVSPLRKSEWGLRAVLADPDGHRIELLQL
jgi:catechol 2,3-dioxygenase-like lactoylglutathione lyase family enzyme